MATDHDLVNLRTPNQRLAQEGLSIVARKPDEWIRKTGLRRTLNDRVEEVHLVLVNASPENKHRILYLALLEAVYDADAVEGSLIADNIEAARVVREYAHEILKNPVRAKLASIAKALTVVLRRYGISRKERRNMLDEKQVPLAYHSADNGGDDSEE